MDILNMKERIYFNFNYRVIGVYVILYIKIQGSLCFINYKGVIQVKRFLYLGK